MPERIEQIIKEVVELKKIVKDQEKRIAQIEKKDGGYVPEFLKERSSEGHVDTSLSKKSEQKKDFETQVGIHYLGRVGMIALLLGVAFFLKYSFDNNWVGLLGRVIIGHISGIILLGVGEWFRRKYENWSRIFTGGGLAILYFATFAAQHFYDLVTWPITLVIMVFVTVVAGVLSVKYDSIVVALFGLVGGFMTPMLIAAGSAREEAMLWLSYIFILNISLLILSWYKKWQVLDLVAFALTVFYMFDLYSVVSINFGILFLLLFFGQFAISTFLFSAADLGREEGALFRMPKEIVILYLIGNATFFYGFLADVTGWGDKVLAAVAFLLSLWYVALTKIFHYFSKEKKYFIFSSLAISFAFAVVAIGLFFEIYWMIALWSVFGLGVVWVGCYTKEYIIRTFGLLILLFPLISSFGKLFDIGRVVDMLPIINPRFLSAVVVLFAVAGAQYLYHSFQKILDAEEKTMTANLAVAANIFSLVLIASEIVQFVGNEQAEQTMISILWGVYAAILIAIGIATKKQYLRIFGLVLFAVTILKVLLVDLGYLETIYRVAAFIIVGFMLLVASFLYQRTQK